MNLLTQVTDAKAFVDNLYQDVFAHWDKKINHGAFMTQLREGTLPLPCLRRFFKDWGLFSIEVVALNAVSYYVHLPFFVDNYDLLPAFSDKIAEELIAPKPPGHILILLETANALRLSKEEFFEQPASARGPRDQRLLPASFSRWLAHRALGRPMSTKKLSGIGPSNGAKRSFAHYGMSKRKKRFTSPPTPKPISCNTRTAWAMARSTA